jgi:hypothetical protein
MTLLFLPMSFFESSSALQYDSFSTDFAARPAALLHTGSSQPMTDNGLLKVVWDITVWASVARQ